MVSRRWRVKEELVRFLVLDRAKKVPARACVWSFNDGLELQLQRTPTRCGTKRKKYDTTVSNS